TSGRYKDAIETFQQAEKLASWNDYTSISEEAGSVLTNESAKTHHLDDYERVLISMYLAIDYTLLGQWESALVEARRVNHQIDKMIREGHPTYTRNSFAKYLAALLFERNGEFNDAWVDYKAVYHWDPSFPLNPIGLLRMSSKLRSEEELIRYKKLFPNEIQPSLNRKEGEVVLLAEVGKTPEKIPDPDFSIIPKLIPRFSRAKKLRLKSKQARAQAETYLLFDIEKAAMIDLEEKRAGLIAKRIASMALKKVAVEGIANQSEATKNLRVFGDMFILLSERADLRSWLLLPGNLQVARLKLPIGVHELFVEEIDVNGTVLSTRALGSLDVKPSSINFLNTRTQF
ncbi:MAG: hypothetical protein ACKN9V_02065, partial [Pseudomonadota bacterium]